jgi:hypothetical protein
MTKAPNGVSSNPCSHYTTAPLVTNPCAHKLASPRRLCPCKRIENTSTAGVAMTLVEGLSSSGARDVEPQLREPTLGPSCQCHLGMALSIGSLCSRLSCSCCDMKTWCWGDRNHTSSAPIVHRACRAPGDTPYLPLVATMLRGTPAPKESTLEVWEAPCANGALLGAPS